MKTVIDCRPTISANELDETYYIIGIDRDGDVISIITDAGSLAVGFVYIISDSKEMWVLNELRCSIASAVEKLTNRGFKLKATDDSQVLNNYIQELLKKYNS